MSCTPALLVLLLVSATSAFTLNAKSDATLNEFWEEYKLTHDKKYDEQFEFVRRLIWESNLKYIQKHNLEYDMGKHSYSLGINHLGDLTNAEYRAQYLGMKRPLRNSSVPASEFMTPLNMGALPDTVDWRTQGYVTPVKDQGQCGSCWAFSTTGSLEGQYFRKTHSLESFSEQQLVDCSGAYGNLGCGGGLMDNAFNYIQKFGIEQEADYTYTARDGDCKYNAAKVVTKVTGHVDIPRGSELKLQEAVATQGPVSVAIDAGEDSFRFYKDGVYDEPACSPTALDHGVLAVGYGTYNGMAFWLVKNSWGGSWGLQGYIRMTRNKDNQCGIATMSSYPTV